MKPVFASVLFLLSSLMAGAQTGQSQAFQKGTNAISLGIGLGSSLLSYSGSHQTPAISAQFERGIWEAGGPGVVSLGGYIGYKSYTYDGSYLGFKWNEKWNYSVIGVRSAYHYTGLKNKQLDVYGGAMLSYDLVSYKYSDNGGGYSGYPASGNYGSGVGFTGFAGGRYFFTNNVAAMAELGYGVSYLTIGATLKM